MIWGIGVDLPLGNDINMNTGMASICNGGSLTSEQVEFYNTHGYLVRDRLLADAELAPARAAMSEKLDRIANELLRDGKINDPLKNRPFPNRLAELFARLTDQDPRPQHGVGFFRIPFVLRVL